MDISAEKTKPMTSSANGIKKEIKVKGQKIDTVKSVTNTSDQLFQIMAQNQRFSQGLRKPLELAIANLER